MKLKHILLTFTFLTTPALAQESDIYVGSGNGVGGALIFSPVGANCTTCVSVPISGTISATLSGFQPNGNTPVTVTAPSGSSSVATTLPIGTTVAFSNTGTANNASVSLGSSAATANNVQIPPNSTVFLAIPGGTTQFTAYGVGGSTTLVVNSGSGLGTNFGGGGSSGGSGSNVSVGTTGAAVPGSATYAGMNVAGNLTGLTGTSNGLKVDGSAVTQPISGTITANAGTGNFTVVQATASNLKTAANIFGNTGAAMDAAGQNAASPANELLVAAQFNTTPTTITTGNVSPLQVDSAGNLLVNVKAGGASGGTSSSFAAAFPATGTAIGVKNGANMVNLTADGSNNLNVNCAVGCTGGTFNNNADAVATSATNGQAAAWLYGFNGSTWDRLRVDASKNLDVNVNAALPAGSAIIGKFGIDQTTPGTTNGVQVNAALPAGTNLIGNFGVGQGSTTSGQSGPLAQGAVTTAAPTYTTAQTDPLSLDTSGNLRVTLAAGSGTITANQGTAAATANAWPVNLALAGTAVSNSNPVPVSPAGNSGSITQTSVSCGTSSTTLLAASSATNFVFVRVPSTAANAVWFNWTNAAAVAAAPSEDVVAGNWKLWSIQGGFLPTQAFTCIASSATTVTLEYK